MRPAKSMVKVAISTDRSRTAPTMAASSSGGCRDEASEAEGPRPAAPVPPVPPVPPRRSGLTPQPQLLGALSRQAPTVCQALSLVTCPSLWGLSGRGTTAAPTPEPKASTESGRGTCCHRSPNLISPTQNGAHTTRHPSVICSAGEEAEVRGGSDFPQCAADALNLGSALLYWLHLWSCTF